MPQRVALHPSLQKRDIMLNVLGRMLFHNLQPRNYLLPYAANMFPNGSRRQLRELNKALPMPPWFGKLGNLAIVHRGEDVP